MTRRHAVLPPEDQAPPTALQMVDARVATLAAVIARDLHPRPLLHAAARAVTEDTAKLVLWALWNRGLIDLPGE